MFSQTNVTKGLFYLTVIAAGSVGGFFLGGKVGKESDNESSGQGLGAYAGALLPIITFALYEYCKPKPANSDAKEINLPLRDNNELHRDCKFEMTFYGNESRLSSQYGVNGRPADPRQMEEGGPLVAIDE